MGSVSWPPWKMDEKLKNENMQKRAVSSVYVIFWEQSGQAGVQNGAMLAVVKFSKFSSSQAARGINPLTKILRTFLNAMHHVFCLSVYWNQLWTTAYWSRRQLVPATLHATLWKLRLHRRQLRNYILGKWRVRSVVFVNYSGGKVVIFVCQLRTRSTLVHVTRPIGLSGLFNEAWVT